MRNVAKLKAVVEAAAEDMAIMLMDGSKPKGKPWRVVPVDELVRRVLPLCEFARHLEGSADPQLAQMAHLALECFLVSPDAFDGDDA